MNQNIVLYSPPNAGFTSYYEMVDAAVACGIGKLETLNMMELREPDVAFAKKLRAYAAERGVAFVCTSVGVNLVGDDRARRLEYVKGYAEVAAALGAPYLHHTIACQVTNPAEVLARREEFFQTGLLAVRQVYDHAATLGIKAIYEPQGYVFNGLDGIARLLREAEREIGLVADFGNIRFADDRFEDFVPRFAEHIVHVHVKDYQITPKAEEPANLCSIGGKGLVDCDFGRGDLNLAAGFDALRRAGYTGDFSMEFPWYHEGWKEHFQYNIRAMENYLQGDGKGSENHAVE